ncbi:hypothetical protein [Leptothoe sp. PORK10 BA2]|uniref:hypothetical protein n=1 Tax=Leptothoe sp. PORK10 BA2 TaxID=3110254 RepID=UPI002B1F4C1E|nr:hypothetical protein [Leptothoe sp. PORK10 BA2]MEA5464888.1 hypothetical protein [Leptothoe sp. PORK10 BA2]
MEHQLRPDELMAELDIKKQTYYNYLDHLGIKAEKDSKGKVYLTQAQADQLRSLRSHVLEGGKIEEFTISRSSSSDLVKMESGGLDSAERLTEIEVEADPTQGLDMETLYREASEIAAQRLTASEQVVLALASQMDYNDLHPEAKAKVDQVREATVPKFDAQAVATDLLGQFRRQRQAPDEQSQPDQSLQTA